MTNLFYIYSDLTRNELHYGYANSKPEISLRVLLNELISSLLALFYNEEPIPFYMRPVKFVEAFLGFVLLFCRGFVEGLLYYWWSILLIVIVIFNYKIIMRYITGRSKLSLLRQIYGRRSKIIDTLNLDYCYFESCDNFILRRRTS